MQNIQRYFQHCYCYSSPPVCQQGVSHCNYHTLSAAGRSFSIVKILENQRGGESWCVLKGEQSTRVFLKREMAAKCSTSTVKWDHGQRKLPGLWIWVCTRIFPFFQHFKNTLVQTPSCCKIRSGVTTRGAAPVKNAK